MLTTFTAHTHFMHWLVFFGLLWSTLLLEMPAIRLLLKRNYFANFLYGFLAQGLLAAVVIGLGTVAGWGKISEITAQGFTLNVPHQINLVSPAYFLLCGGLAVLIFGLKTALFYRLASKPPHKLAVMVFGVLCLLSTSLFVTTFAVDQNQLIAKVYEKVMGQRMPAGTLEKGVDPMKSAEPLLKYYQDLNKLKKSQ